MAFLVRVSFKDPFLHNYAMSSFPFTHCSSSQLLETFENQLSTLRKDLENKDKMLVMYENSMSDIAPSDSPPPSGGSKRLGAYERVS